MPYLKRINSLPLINHISYKYAQVSDIGPSWSSCFLRIDVKHCDRINFLLKAVLCFDNGYVGKQPLAWKEYCVEYWLKELQESVDRCTGCRNITEILLKQY